MNAVALLETLDRTGFHVMRALLSYLWQSSILLIAVALLAYLLRRRRAGVRHSLWVAALLVAPSLPFLTQAAARIGTPRAQIPVMPSYTVEHIPPARIRIETYEPLPAEETPSPLPAAEVQVLRRHHEVLHPRLRRRPRPLPRIVKVRVKCLKRFSYCSSGISSMCFTHSCLVGIVYRPQCICSPKRSLTNQLVSP